MTATRADLRKAWAEWSGEDYTNPIGVTFATNIHKTSSKNKTGEEHLVYGRHAIDFVDTRSMSKLLTKKYKTSKSSRRVVGIIFPEHIESNIHWHGVIDAKNIDTHRLLENYNHFWNLKYPAGDVKFEVLETREKWNGYTLKEFNVEHAVFIPSLGARTLHT